MQGDDSASFSSAILHNVVRLLDGLKQTPAGIVIHDQITRLLAECESEQQKVEQSYLSLLSILLEAYTRNPSSDNVMLITAKLIQLRPTPPLTESSINLLREELLQEPRFVPTGPEREADGRRFDRLLAELAQWPEFHSEKTRAADRPMEAPYAEPPEDRMAGDQPSSAQPAAPDLAASTELPESEADSTLPVERRTRAREKKMQQILADEEARNPPFVERRVNSAYRMHLNRKRDEIDKLQETLVNKVAEAINQNKEFGALLEIERGALQQAESIQEIETLRQILLGGIDELLQGQSALAKKLRGSSDYLQLVKSDSERLHDELNKVRLLSLTDEFTGLPNRRAFMRRLEDEIGRAQRYGTPLALALIDLDEFKLINDTHGHAAGDDVLRCYANNVLSIFRHHDMVARYGGEEFSVLLPNTASEGALCALRKVQGRAQKTYCEHVGNRLTLPTFSAGLTLYVPGETPSGLIDRADKALYSAKRMGRDRIEVGPTGQAEHSVPENTNGG